jgi:hypothetical protein
MAAAKVMVAVTPFSGEAGGEQHLVHEGERFVSTHPLVRKHPELFEPEEADVKRPRRGSKP